MKSLKVLCYFFLLFFNFNFYSIAHMKGTFSSEQEALTKSLELGCNGTHKNMDKWLPCENEKELHKFLNKKGSTSGDNLASSLALIFIVSSIFGILWLSIFKTKKRNEKGELK